MIRKTSPEFQGKSDVLTTELKNSGAVSEVAESAGTVTTIWGFNGGFDWEGKDQSLQENFGTVSVSHDYGKTVGWQFIAGRDFAKDMYSDSAAFIINETAMRYMGLKDAVGKTIKWDTEYFNGGNFKIIGVIKDMVMSSPFAPAPPMIFFLGGFKGWIFVKIDPEANTQEALSKIEAVFKKIVPPAPFDYKFASDAYAAKFKAEERMGKLALVFAVLAIFISFLGLSGLASFVAGQRTKEIGIRKVLGATVSDVWQMLSRDFVVLTIISCLIAIPLGYYFMNSWLQKYEYRTEISWWIFLATGAGALAITILTVSFQAVKAALVNPVNSLRSE
jgi:ABC-type antimicrobial peptide transport system permease subunit